MTAGAPGQSLAGKAAIVTGASRGIGREVALHLQQLGAKVGSIQRGDGVGVSVSADLADPEQAETAFVDVADRLGSLDICVYAAGVNHRGPVLDVSFADWRRVLDVNLHGAFVVTRAAARRLVSCGRAGAIVHVASELSFFGGVNVAPYAASKGAVVQLMKAQSNEWSPLGIRVNAVAPGWIETEMTEALRTNPETLGEITHRIPTGRWGSVTEVANAVTWLVSESASYVTGSVLVVDGGYLAR